jgi:hypothetical protein
MNNIPENPELNEHEIRSRLEKIIYRDPNNGPKQVALFAARCGLRVLPLLAKGNGFSFFRFNYRQREHVVACWRSLMIPLSFTTGRIIDRQAIYDLANATAAADAVTSRTSADIYKYALATRLYAADTVDDEIATLDFNVFTAAASAFLASRVYSIDRDNIFQKILLVDLARGCSQLTSEAFWRSVSTFIRYEQKRTSR